jgi:hypothetical protein
MMVRGYISKPQSSSYSPSSNNSDYAERENELRSSDGTEKMEYVSHERTSNQSTQQGNETVVKSNTRPMQQLCIKLPVSQIGQTHQHAYLQSSSSNSGTTTSTTQCHSIPQQIHHLNQKHNNAIQQTNIEQVRTANSVTVVVIKAMLPDK